MTDNNEQEQKRPLTLTRPSGRLELRKPAEAGQVRQSFPHGRSKTVTVEVRKKRSVTPGVEAEAAPAAKEAGPAPAATPAAGIRRPVIMPRTLTAEERAGRVRALQGAIKADVAA